MNKVLHVTSLATMLLFVNITTNRAQSTPPPPVPPVTVLNNHFDVIQKLSSVQSKSRQVVVMMKQKLTGRDLDSAKLLYMDLKASSDGVISRYKAMIDNPKMAKKEGEMIGQSFLEVDDNLNKLRKFNVEHGNSSMGLAGLVIVATVTELGKGIYSEIKSIQTEKRNEMKSEVDKYILPDWDSVQ